MSDRPTLAATILVNFAIVRLPTLEQGLSRILRPGRGRGPDGWRPHFFCRDAEAGSVLHDVGMGAYGPGNTVAFLERSIMSSYSSKLYPNCTDGLLAKTRFSDSI